jgi:hypothetical protein
MSILRNGIEILTIIDTKYDISADLTARKVWQQLFNCYRMFGGDMNNLDNLLIDYTSLIKLFKKGRTQLAWCMYRNHFHTRLLLVEDNECLSDGDVKVTIICEESVVKLEVEHLTGL